MSKAKLLQHPEPSINATLSSYLPSLDTFPKYDHIKSSTLVPIFFDTFCCDSMVLLPESSNDALQETGIATRCPVSFVADNMMS